MTQCVGLGRFDVEGVHVTGWIDREIEPFVLVVLAEKFAVKTIRKSRTRRPHPSRDQSGRCSYEWACRTVQEIAPRTTNRDRRHSHKRSHANEPLYDRLAMVYSRLPRDCSTAKRKSANGMSTVRASPEEYVDPSLPSGLD